MTGIDRVELRRRNLIRPEALPYHTPTHHNYDSGEFEKLMDKCLTLADWKGFAARRKESERRGKLRGRAVTPYIELGGVFNERMEIRFDPGGMVTIIAGTHSHGQGHATAFAQLVAEWLGVPFEAINYIQGDTEKVAFGRGTFAARSSLVGGNAITRRGRRGHCPRQGNGGRADGGGASRHRIQRRHLHGDGNRQAHVDRRRRPRLLCSGRAGDETRSRARRRRHLVGRARRRAELSEWLPGVRSRGRSGNRCGAHRPFCRRRRSRHGRSTR